MFTINYSLIKKQDLYQTREEDLSRFAKYLGLQTTGYSHKQRARLVYWLLTRRRYEFMNTAWT